MFGNKIGNNAEIIKIIIGIMEKNKNKNVLIRQRHKGGGVVVVDPNLALLQFVLQVVHFRILPSEFVNFLLILVRDVYVGILDNNIFQRHYYYSPQCLSFSDACIIVVAG